MKRFINREVTLVTLIVLLGSFLRLYHLDYPLGLHGDEAWTGIDALRILSGEQLGIWSEGLRQPNGIVYWTALLFHTFNSDLFTLRLSYALFWIVSLPFFYGIVRLLFGKSVAIVAFFLFVIERTLLNFSHIAYSPYIPPFLIATFFFLYAVKTKKKWLFALSGFLTGLSLYFYFALFLLPLFFLCYLIYSFYKPKLFFKNRTSLLFFVLFFSIASIPLAIDFYYAQIPTTARLDEKSIFTGQEENSFTILVNQLSKTLLMFHVSGDADNQDNINNLPLLDHVSGIFFILGFVYCLMNIRKKPFIFLLLWFSIFLIGTIVTVGAPNFRRIQPSIAATTIIIALGIIWSYQSFSKRFPRYLFIHQFILGISILSISYANPYFYFQTQAVADSTRHMFGYPILKTAELLSSINKEYPNTYAYLYADNYDIYHPTIQFIARNAMGENRDTSLSIINDRQNQSVIYIFPPKYINLFHAVHELYPGGKDYLVKDTNGTILLYAYLIVQ